MLAKEGPSTILLDLQPYGLAVANQLGFTIARVDPSLLRVKPEDLTEAPVESFLNLHPTGLRVFPSIYPDFSTEEVSPEFVEKLVYTLSTMADYLLIDAGTRFTKGIDYILRESSKVVMVAESDPLALRMGASLIKELEKFGIRGIKLIVVLVNRTRSQTAFTKLEAEEILKHSIQVVIPPAPELFHQAEKEGIPAVLLGPGSLVSDQIKAIVQLIKQ
ncbi:MAG: hypothetical protein DRI61_11095 [Chloroflexi bacterium]|nr:MAG: hypothetical protein DRI61_11095 [Chloroflexota bacterium]